jgi:uncharacterized membrane protein
MILRVARAVGRTSRLAVTSSVVLRELGPQAAIALILPGGSLIALAMWTLRRRAWFTPLTRRMLVVAAAVGASLILPGNL